MKKKIIILLGLPGSGKGTQGEFLAKELGLPHISTGTIFRKMVNEINAESQLLKEHMNLGKLVPSNLVNKIVIKFLCSDECQEGCVLDGYPRNLEQADFLFSHVEAEFSTVFFDASDEVVIKRILGRYSCTACGVLYNKYFNNPKLDNVCDVCGGKDFTFREDDNERITATRIEQYKKETMPLVNYYKNKKGFFAVDADKTKEKVLKEVSLIAKKV